MKVTREMGTVLADTTMRSPVYLDVRTTPCFKLYGFWEPFRRIPEEVAKATSEGVTGGRQACAPISWCVWAPV